MGQDVYRLAFDEATAELNEIIGRVEQLRQRKDRIEKFVEAFRPLLGLEVEEPAAEEEAVEALPFAMEQAVEPEPVATQAAADRSRPIAGSGRADIGSVPTACPECVEVPGF